ncbi:hypothetical protein MMC11_006362 [Xylographa trunciseda]|nr:hypothetical protein [Xylographa trunciseda]
MKRCLEMSEVQDEILPKMKDTESHINLMDNREVVMQEKVAKRAKLYDSIVTIVVGPKERSYIIHKGILCKHATYFEAALSEGFLESKTMIIHLDEEDPKIFDIFINWLYVRKIVPDDASVTDMSWQTKAELYIFADRRGCSALKSDTIDLMIEHALDNGNSMPPYALPSNPVVCHIWENTPASSPLRRLMVDVYAYLVVLTDAETSPGSLPHSFLRDVLAKYFELTSERVNIQQDFGGPGFAESYHETVSPKPNKSQK